MQLTAGPPPPGMAAVDPLWAANRTIAGVEWNIREGACNPPSSGYSIGSGLVLRTFFLGLDFANHFDPLPDPDSTLEPRFGQGRFGFYGCSCLTPAIFLYAAA